MKVLTALFPTIVLLSLTVTANFQSQTNSQRVPVSAGEIGPEFTLQDQNGHKATLSDAREKSPVVLVFYRGYW